MLNTYFNWLISDYYKQVIKWIENISIVLSHAINQVNEVINKNFLMLKVHYITLKI